MATGDFGHDDVVLNWNQYFTDLDLLKERRGMDIDHHGIPRTKLTSYDETSHPTLGRKLLGSSQAGS